MNPNAWLHHPYPLYSQAFTYPDNVAFPFGGEESSEYVVMEMHYDNPHGIQGAYIANTNYGVCTQVV